MAGASHSCGQTARQRVHGVAAQSDPSMLVKPVQISRSIAQEDTASSMHAKSSCITAVVEPTQEALCLALQPFPLTNRLVPLSCSSFTRFSWILPPGNKRKCEMGLFPLSIPTLALSLPVDPRSMNDSQCPKPRAQNFLRVSAQVC